LSLGTRVVSGVLTLLHLSCTFIASQADDILPDLVIFI